ncbi:hypothetical protein OG496_05140 [Streptomyces sp. NBC_00988]|nr:hypothetical protein OG496_05140 [Streptomyces sp. NBC_00988]
MTRASPRAPFTDWLREHAVPLTHLDPEAPLDPGSIEAAFADAGLTCGGS